MEFLLSLPVHRRRSRTFARIAWRRSLSPEHVVVDLRSSPNFSTARKKMAISEKVQGLWKTAGGPPRSVFLAYYYSAYLCVCGHPIMNYLPHPPHGNSSLPPCCGTRKFSFHLAVYFSWMCMMRSYSSRAYAAVCVRVEIDVDEYCTYVEFQVAVVWGVLTDLTWTTYPTGSDLFLSLLLILVLSDSSSCKEYLISLLELFFLQDFIIVELVYLCIILH